MKINIKNDQKILLVILSLIVLCLYFFIPSKPIKQNNDVINFANNIVKEYRLKNNYSGLQKTFNGLIAGNESGELTEFGAKNFFISAKKTNKEKCVSLLQSNTQELNLISIKINKQNFFWGKGLPLTKKQIKNLCQKENNIIWNFL